MKRVTRRGVGLCLTFAMFLALLASCTATRTITTTQAHTKNGDTLAVMTTKTIESYTATKTSPMLP